MTIVTGNTEPGVTVSPLVDERMRSNEPEIYVDLESPDIPIAYAYAVPETAENSTPANPAAANSSATSPAHSFTPATNLGRVSETSSFYQLGTNEFEFTQAPKLALSICRGFL